MAEARGATWSARTAPRTGPRLVIDLGGTCVRFAVADEQGTIDRHHYGVLPVAQRISSRGALLDLIVETIIAHDPGQPMHALSVAGPVSDDHRVVRRYTNVLPGDSDIPLASLVEAELRARTGAAARVLVMKDADASTMAEMGPGGAAADREEAIALILGTGTGGAPGRRLASGDVVFPDALADLGHHRVDPEAAEPCNCGSRGCVERQTSGTAVVAAANRRSEDGRFSAAWQGSALVRSRGVAPGRITGEDLAWAAAAGDAFAIGVLREAAKPLSLLVRNIFTSHPRMTVVLVGGFAAGAGAVLVDLLRAALRQTGIPFLGQEETGAFVARHVLAGTLPPDRTNLVGARLFLRQEEQRGGGGRGGFFGPEASPPSHSSR